MKINMVAANAQSKVTKLCKIDYISKRERERILQHRLLMARDFVSSDSDPYYGYDSGPDYFDRFDDRYDSDDYRYEDPRDHHLYGDEEWSHLYL